MPPQTFIMTLPVSESFCWLVTELLNETTALYISKGKMAGTAERSSGMMETKEKRWNKQRRGRREGDENIFFCALLAVLHSSPIISPSCAESLMFNYWKHSSSPSPAKQYPAYISSRQHLTDGNIKIWCRVEGAGAGSRRADGSKWAWAQLIVTVTKPLVGRVSIRKLQMQKNPK